MTNKQQKVIRSGSWPTTLAVLMITWLPSLAGALDLVGTVSDAVIIPPQLNTFNPPRGAGSSYIDAAFGTKITRVTDNLIFNQFVVGGYYGNSEICYFNKDGSYLIAMENTLHDGKPKLAAFLYDGNTGARLKMIGAPNSGLDAYYIRWALADRYRLDGKTNTFDPNFHFYFVTGNEIRLYNVQSMNYVVLHKFNEYKKIGTAGGEGDISLDGRFWVLDGDDKELFVYDLINDVKYRPSSFDLGSLGSKGGNVGVDYAAVSSQGNFVVVSWGTDAGMGRRFAGIELYDKEWNFIRQLHPSIVHWDSGIDHAGDEVIYTAVTHDFPQFFASCGATPGDLVSVRLADGRQRLLKDIPNWAHMSISACNAMTNGDYIFVAYHNRSADPTKLWYPFWDEVFALKTDGSQEVRRFVHHRSHSVEGQSTKYYQPDAMVNRQGTRVIYRSTYNTGIGDLYLFSTVAQNADPDDKTPPNPPVGLRTNERTFDSIELTWQQPSPAGDGDLPIYYRVYRGDAFLANIFDTRFLDVGLEESSEFVYQVLSVDNAGNESMPVRLTAATLPDLTPPTVTATRILDAANLQITFSEKMDPASTLNLANYQFTPPLTLYEAKLEDGVSLTLKTAPLELGIQYRLFIQNVADASKAKNVIIGSVHYFALLSGFFDDFESGINPAWIFKTPSRWQLDTVAGNRVLFLNTTEYGDAASKLLGEYALVRDSDKMGTDLIISCLAQSNEDIVANQYADYAVVFGYLDDRNYYYVQFQPAEVKLHRLVDGERTLYENYYFRSSFDGFDQLFIELKDTQIRTVVGGRQIFKSTLPETPRGLIGVGSFNDSARFDNVNIGPASQWDTTPPRPPRNLKIVGESGR